MEGKGVDSFNFVVSTGCGWRRLKRSPRLAQMRKKLPASGVSASNTLTSCIVPQLMWMKVGFSPRTSRSDSRHVTCATAQAVPALPPG